MSRLNSFHLPASQWPTSVQPGQLVTLDGPEARHLLGVLRAKPGEVVRLFDGQGRHGRFALQTAKGKNSALLEAVEIVSEQRPASGLVLALGWSKSSRRDWLLEKGVELDAAGLWFWRGARSQGDVPDAPKDTWEDKLVQSAKQCGASWLPELRCVAGGSGGLGKEFPNFANVTLLWEGAEPGAILRPGSFRSGLHLAIVGPEGGLDEEEARHFLSAGATPASLGPRPLRWETAALLCLGLAHQDRISTGANGN